ncbi:MAG: universal stress protein [Saprospiraceae bacterium]|nr:universal stress protein [Saprospiraceae bacterium]
MKNIICPIDFSDASKHAVNYAVHLTNHFKGTIHLVHAYMTKKTASMLINMDEAVKEGLDTDMGFLMDQIRPDILPGTQVKTYLQKGSAVSVITHMAEQMEDSLIVLGKTGLSNLKTNLFGSVSTAVIRKSSVPVLAIPREAKLRIPRRVVLALDQNPTKEDDSLNALIHLLNEWGAQLHLYHLIESEEDPGIHPRTSKQLENVPYSLHFELSQKDLSDSLHSYLESIQADVLCMIRHQKTFFEKLFHASHIRKERSNVDYPLLVIPD